MPQAASGQVQSTQPDVHVLFVHGVGRHMRLSSLLQGFQSIRSFLQSPEPPVQAEDAFREWRLAKFNDASSPVALKLELTDRDSDTGRNVGDVYLYEVNYAALAGVVRENHPLDMTGLFLGLDLAINVARTRLNEDFEGARGRLRVALKRHVALANLAQKISGVLTAATVPVLGLPSILLRGYVAPFVATFTRFFEDVATFAIDRNGEAVISGHFDHTVQGIVKAGDEIRKANGRPQELVIVAHSLGTVVTHNFVVRHWLSSELLPKHIITLGSPIGLVCWLWRFLDFRRLHFNPKQPEPEQPYYFSWIPGAPVPGAGKQIHWVNVAAHLDPIATAFPTSDVYLSAPDRQIAKRLRGGAVHTRLINTGGYFSGFFSAGAAHTRYFDNKETVIETLGKAARMRASWLKPSEGDPENEHWQRALKHLRAWRWVALVAGAVFLGLYMYWLSRLFGIKFPWLFFFLYLGAPWVIAYLAFWQRLFFGRPTKRTFGSSIERLSPFDRHSFPYRMHRWLFRDSEAELNKRRPAAPKKLVQYFISFVPTVVLMLLPLLYLLDVPDSWHRPSGGSTSMLVIAGLVALFMAYTLAFGLSQFVSHWAESIRVVIPPTPPTSWLPGYRWVCHKCSQVNQPGRECCTYCGFPAIAEGRLIALHTEGI